MLHIFSLDGTSVIAGSVGGFPDKMSSCRYVEENKPSEIQLNDSSDLLLSAQGRTHTHRLL